MNLTSKTVFAAGAMLACAATAAACPKVQVVKNTGNWVITNAGGSQVEAAIANPSIVCNINGNETTATVKVTMTGNRSGEKVPVYVAVANMTQGVPIFTSKDVYNKTLENGSVELVFDDIQIPLGQRGVTSDYNVLVGFQLSNEQLSEQRRKNSWFSWLF